MIGEISKEDELGNEDHGWFEELVHKYAEGALKFAYLQVNDRDLARDMVQEAFTRSWASPRTPRDGNGFKRWLYRSIANLANDHRRHQKRVQDWNRRSVPSIAHDEFERWMSAELLLQGLKRLRLRDRQLLYLRYFEDLSTAECARMLGLHPVSVRVLLRRALGRLQRELPKTEFFPEVASNAN